MTATTIAADAIDGKTITGATIRTSASNPKLQMDSAGLTLYDASAQAIVDLDAAGLTFWTSGGTDPTLERAVNFIDAVTLLPAGGIWTKRVGDYQYELKGYTVPLIGSRRNVTILNSADQSDFIRSPTSVGPSTRTINRGSYSFTVGGSVVSKTENIPHGLGITPIAAIAVVDYLNGAGTSKLHVTVANFGSTNFEATIRAGDNTNLPTGNIVVKWIAMT